MLIKSSFEVAQPVDKVWEFFDDIPQVAACLPGAELTEDLGDNRYNGTGRHPHGPGQAAVRRHRRRSRSATTRPSASSSTPPAPTRRAADRPPCRAPRAWRRRATAPGSTSTLDLQLSGAAAQYGRGMISDVTADPDARLRRTACRPASTAIDRGLSPDQVGEPRAASGFAIGLRAMRLALGRVLRRFFLPYQPNPS